MKRAIVFTAGLVLAISSFAQDKNVRGEFAVESNGLMYSDGDIKALRYIVDSLNLRFKTCDPGKTYYSWPQTTVYEVTFTSKTNNLSAIIEQIDNNADFDYLVKKFAGQVESLDSGKLFIRTGKGTTSEPYQYLLGSPGGGYDEAGIYDAPADAGDTPSGWTYDYSPKTSDDDEFTLQCRYFPYEWKQIAIPEEYARHILYVDCMIDTSASVFLTDKFTGGWLNEKDESSYSDLGMLSRYLDRKMNLGDRNEAIRELNEVQLKFAVSELRQDTAFRSLLSTTIDGYIKNKTPQHDLEYLAQELDMHAKALTLKRCYQVMGSCSQDSRPREHARDIAILAARAHSWDIFLRAHLDIMNDRFVRSSDGSYAWNDRKTYLKELEELNLNIVDLMIGLSLRAENVAANHYHGTIWRLGWGLTESREKEVFENKAMAILKDESLDQFNRGLIFLLYKTYLRRLPRDESSEKISALKENIKSFPLFLHADIKRLAPQDLEDDE